MFPFSTVMVAQIGDHTLYSIHNAWLTILVLALPVLLFGTMYLANKPQPTPNPDAWRQNEGR